MGLEPYQIYDLLYIHFHAQSTQYLTSVYNTAVCHQLQPLNMDETGFVVLSADEQWEHDTLQDNLPSIDTTSPASSTDLAQSALQPHSDSNFQAGLTRTTQSNMGRCPSVNQDISLGKAVNDHSGGAMDNALKTNSTQNSGPQASFTTPQKPPRKPQAGSKPMRPYAPHDACRICPTQTAFIPSKNLKLEENYITKSLEQSFNVKWEQVGADQHHDQGWLFEVIPNSACSSLNNVSCGRLCTRLLHQWEVSDQTWIISVRAACAHCQSADMYPLPICQLPQSSGGPCNMWRTYASSSRAQNHLLCESHYKEFNSRRSAAWRKSHSQQESWGLDQTEAGSNILIMEKQRRRNRLYSEDSMPPAQVDATDCNTGTDSIPQSHFRQPPTAAKGVLVSQVAKPRRQYASGQSIKPPPTHSVFVCLQDLDIRPQSSVLSHTSNVSFTTNATALQYPDQGWRFEVISGTSCPGVHGVPCGRHCSRLMHQRNLGLLTDQLCITDVQASCNDCQASGWSPLTACNRKGKMKGIFCDTWFIRAKGPKTLRTFCEAHLAERNSNESRTRAVRGVNQLGEVAQTVNEE